MVFCLTFAPENSLNRVELFRCQLDFSLVIYVEKSTCNAGNIGWHFFILYYKIKKT
jgi:hypothetical protein